jgi:fumarylacetoacetase
VNSLYSVHNLPYCAFDGAVGVRVGGSLLNLSTVESAGLLDAGGAFAGATTLNPLLALGRPQWTAIRAALVALLTGETDLAAHLRPVAGTRFVLPFEVGDYVDFYSSEEHATNLGKLFRPGAPPLLPNWKHLPIGYHGRAGTVVVSGTEIVRPCGQRLAGDAPEFGPSQRLDIEAEVGFVVGVPSRLGEPLTPASFEDHVFGVVLVNDWSARDIQAWEYQPLGPFLGKSFATSISPYVVPLEALHFARTAAPAQEPEVLPYLKDARVGYDFRLEVRWNGTLVSTPPYAGIYWTPAQQLAHLTANGASVRTGDLYASGTVSGPRPDQTGSFIELSWNGAQPVRLDDGGERTFLQDGDTVTINGTAPGPDGTTIGLGEVTGVIRQARRVGPS